MEPIRVEELLSLDPDFLNDPAALMAALAATRHPSTPPAYDMIMNWFGVPERPGVKGGRKEKIYKQGGGLVHRISRGPVHTAHDRRAHKSWLRGAAAQSPPGLRLPPGQLLRLCARPSRLRLST